MRRLIFVGGMRASPWGAAALRRIGDRREVGVRGTLTGAGSGAAVAPDAWAIGAYGPGCDRFFRGNVDDVRIYGTNIGANRIAELASGRYAYASINRWPAGLAIHFGGAHAGQRCAFARGRVVGGATGATAVCIRSRARC